MQVRYRKTPVILRLAVAIHCGEGRGGACYICCFQASPPSTPHPRLSSLQQILVVVGVVVVEGCQESSFLCYFILVFSKFLLSESLNFIVFYNFQKFHTHDFI